MFSNDEGYCGDLLTDEDELEAARAEAEFQHGLATTEARQIAADTDGAFSTEADLLAFLGL